MSSRVNDLLHKYLFSIIIFIVSFAYILFFSQCVPFFFDDHELHSDYVQRSYIKSVKQIFSFNTGAISDGSRPVYGVFFKTLFPLFGFDYCKYRVVKGLIFSGVVVLLYVLSLHLFRSKTIATLFSLYFMTNFPFYIQTLVYDGPHIIAEFFKLIAIIVFLKDISKEKTNYSGQIVIFVCALLAIRTYPPAFSIAGVLPLFVLFYDFNKFVRYVPLFVVVFLIQFPVTLNFSDLHENELSVYSPTLMNVYRLFTNDVAVTVLNPIPNFGELYYKSFFAIVTFFGFWLIIVAGIVLVAKGLFASKVRNRRTVTFDKRKIVCLAIVWMSCEITNYFFLPEHAIRYVFAFFIPFTFLIILLVVQLIYSFGAHKKMLSVFVLLMVVGAAVTNVSYVYAFRAGWGSSFIVFEEVMDYFAANYKNNVGVLYSSGAVAIEYKHVNKCSREYEFGTGIEYLQSDNVGDFSESMLKETAKKYSSFFVLKRTTSVSKNEYPPVDFEKYPLLSLVATFEGFDDRVLFDRVNDVVMHLLGVDYTPNRVRVYQFKRNKPVLQV